MFNEVINLLLLLKQSYLYLAVFEILVYYLDNDMFFLTDIWLLHGQLWAILKGKSSPTWC